MKYQNNLFLFTVLIILLGCNAKQKHPPTDSEGRPLIEKTGTIDGGIVESTPIVFNGKVYRFEYIRETYWNNQTGDSYFRFVNRETGETTTPFAKGYHLGSAFVDNNTVYVTAANKWDGEQIHVFASNNLEEWAHWMALELPGYGIFNTSLTKSGDKFVLMFEIGKPEEEAGKYFTARFATSFNLKEWEVLPPECNYAKERYTAPHCLRYLDGYYYNFYLEANDGYETRVVRSKDLEHWEPSPLNPVLRASDADRFIAKDKFPNKMQRFIKEEENCNNSDMDFCEFEGKLIINYSWGNQKGEEFLAEASYNGTLKEFLKGWFPD